MGVVKHGGCGTLLYEVWISMKQRCCNKKNKAYFNYGGRGIYICEEWLHDYGNFYNWAIANGYKKGLSLDRVDNNGPYSPENCRWATRYIQNNNKNSNHLISYKNKNYTMREFADAFNLTYSCVKQRVKSNWDPDKIANTPTIKDRNRYITFNNETLSVNDWAKRLGISASTLWSRIQKNDKPLETILLIKNVKGHLITYKNETKSISQWCKIFKTTKGTVSHKLAAGMTPEEIFENIPLRSEF